MPRYGMVVDLLRCIGCYGCQTSCKAENATPRGVTWGRVEVTEMGKYPNVTRLNLPLLCMHCREPECEKVCPSGATVKGADGIVTVDDTKCIGCRYCMMACPYGARYSYDKLEGYFGSTLTPYEEQGYPRHKVGTVLKCDFCKHRLEAGEKKGLKIGVDREATPACVINCMCKARWFGDLDDPESEVSRLVASGQAFQLNPELGTDPQVYYLPAGRIVSENI
ncbi:MAG: 4Fe-4S dicluster domain-containing protein [Dehalococcoidia bacterium]|nr:4Fe-4S dicluster domain-containing protein [Dehalococcoidia bacterium]